MRVVGGRASLIESILADSALRVDELGSKAWTADVVFHRTTAWTTRQNKALARSIKLDWIACLYM